MTAYRYRAATAAGELRSGTLDGPSHARVLERLRRAGLTPIEAIETTGTAARPGAVKSTSVIRQAVANAIGELAVLLGAGLTLDRAMSVCTQNLTNPAMKAAFSAVHDRVKEGAPLSQAMLEHRDLFPPIASAMAEAGEANGKLGAALARLAETLDRAEALRQTITSSLVYPTLLIVVASSVILVMLLGVVPQFEGLLRDAQGKLPFATQAVMAVSDTVRAYGLPALLVLVVAMLGLRQWLKSPSVRLAFDRNLLRMPQIGALVANAETAAFARTLGSLVDGGVPLPAAMGIAQRSVTNTHMSAAIGKVAAELKEGGGLSGPLAVTGLFPPMAISFLRTGEETAQLALMLERLADVLDRTVRTTIQRMIAVLTPSITVGMGIVVAFVIASIYSAILGFNDLALAP